MELCKDVFLVAVEQGLSYPSFSVSLRPHMHYFYTHLSYPIYLWPFLGDDVCGLYRAAVKGALSVEARGLGSVTVVCQPSNW